MKKTFFSLLALLTAVVLSVGFASCGDDDDEEGGSVPSSGFTLVGKTFSKSETNYSDIGEKEVNKETVYFKTETTCIVHRWGSWENIYRDGSKDTNKYNTGDMECTYSVSGSKVSVFYQGDSWEYTIVGGVLQGFKLSSDDNA